MAFMENADIWEHNLCFNINKVQDKDGASTTKTVKVTVNEKEIIPMPDKLVPPDKPATLDNIPQTGDNSNIMM